MTEQAITCYVGGTECSEEEVTALRDMVNGPGYAVYLRILAHQTAESMRCSVADPAVKALDIFMREQGRYLTIENLKRVPDEIAEAIKAIQAAKEISQE